jgi:predicted acylesterase/phospholipase RssA
MSLERAIDGPGPKRILACDGGGIRGLISVEILAELEAQLRAARGNPNLVLADVFDLVCGTSTGAVIAACIATGMPMEAIRSFYVGSGEQMFDKTFILRRLLNYQYDAEPLALKLRQEINRALGHPVPTGKLGDETKDATLGDPGLRALLMMVTRNHTTDSPWPFWNHPRSRYNRRTRDDGSPRLNCNLDLPLWQLVRASTAAPTYFPPEVVTLGAGTPQEQSFVFVDGGVTTYNNPAFLAFEMATAAPYQLGWKTGVDDLLIVSVGTGSAPAGRPTITPEDMHKIHHATTLPIALMNAAAEGWDLACRTLGRCTFGAPIDRQIGSMVDPANPDASSSGPKLFTYVRYDVELSDPGLAALGLAGIDPSKVQQLDAVANTADLQRIGQAYASQRVQLAHLGSHGRG